MAGGWKGSTTECDYLTKLPNRGGLFRFYDSMDRKSVNHYMFLDLDNFKTVNDIYGHSTGDELLVLVSKVLVDNVTEGSFISRIGGDEFVIVLPGHMSRTDVENTASAILHAVFHTGKRRDVITHISLSIGIVIQQSCDCSLDDILCKCDTAMYRAKQSGKNRYVAYDIIEREFLEWRKIENEMRSALDKKELRIYYQPRMNMVTSELVGAEALIRWEHPADGLLDPEQFLPVFENTGFILEVDLFVFESVCRQKQIWNSADLAALPVSVNLSRLHFYQEDFSTKLIEITDRYNVDRSELILEITESAFVKDTIQIEKIIKTLKEAGFKIAIDDFGSGYSSLNMLKSAYIDELKLDGSFLSLSGHGERGRLVIKNVLSMGKDLKLELIAEGVESQEQVLFLTGCGCELAQGHYYCRALAMIEFEMFAKEWKRKQEHAVRFSFCSTLLDESGMYKGEFKGTEVTYGKGVVKDRCAIYFPGGPVKQNYLQLPADVLKSESYSISLWICPNELVYWVSVLFIEFDNGFASLVPSAWEGTAVYRMKDDREVLGWYDTRCCSLPVNQWTYLTVTYDARSEICRLYFNGRQAAVLEHIPPLRITKQIMLGGDKYQPSFRGYVCELMISDRVASEAEAESMYRGYLEQQGFGISEQEKTAEGFVLHF